MYKHILCIDDMSPSRKAIPPADSPPVKPAQRVTVSRWDQGSGSASSGA